MRRNKGGIIEGKMRGSYIWGLGERNESPSSIRV
jgi:hypothetical protein